MAKVWPVYEGSTPTIGEPWAVLPLDDAIRILDLEPSHFHSDLSRIPKFGNATQSLTLGGYKHVVVEVDDNEPTEDWKAGFYRSPLAPSKAFFKILEWRIGEQLGRDWRIELQEGSDADGDRAIWAWVALRVDAPDAAWSRENRKRIQGELRKTVAESGISEWVFVRFRNDKEERVAS